MFYKAKYTAIAKSISPTNNKLNLIPLAKFFFRLKIININPNIKDITIIQNPIVITLSLIYLRDFSITKLEYIVM